MGFIKREKYMGSLKDKYIGLQDRYGWVVKIGEMLVENYPELIRTKMLIKGLINELPIISANATTVEAVQRAACKDELIIEICESIAKDFYSEDFNINKERANLVDWKELYRFMTYREEGEENDRV
jgi:hypothetical protein